MVDLLERLQAALADRYAVESEIGRGGMATVYVAEDLKHRRKVAIKVLHPELSVTLAAERFLNEIQIAAGLNHPHILMLIDSGEADGLLYYVMPYVPGESLRHRLEREGQLPVEEAVRIAVEVADGLQHAHEEGVIHRDVKPGNILLSGKHAVITDFGIARAITVAQEARVTSTGLGVGTPLYASPEQVMGAETLDGRTDVYSLGCVLYEMLAGQVPLAASTPQAVQARRMTETPGPIHPLRDTVPPLLDQVIARALTRLPADRWESAEKFGQALMTATMDATPVARLDLMTTPGLEAIAAGGRRRLPLRWAIAAGVVAVAALGTWLVVPQVALLTGGGEQTAGPPADGVATETKIPLEGWFGEMLWFGTGSFAISPDGSLLAYCSYDGESRTGRLWLADLSNPDRPQRALANTDDHCTWVRWAPKGDRVFFVAAIQGTYGNYEAPTSGGYLRRFTECALTDSTGHLALDDRHAFLSPDESRTVYGMEWGFRIVPTGSCDFAAGDSVKLEATPWLVSWSPDGDRLLFRLPGVGDTLWTIKTDGNGRQMVWAGIRGSFPRWPESAEAIYYTNGRNLMRVPVARSGKPQGEPEVVAGSDEHPINIYSLSDDGRTVVFARVPPRRFRIVRVVPGVDTSPSNVTVIPVTETLDGYGAFALSHDGQWVAYGAREPGRGDLFKVPIEGGQPTRLTRSGIVWLEEWPAWSADDQFLAFSGQWEDTLRLWLVSADGRTAGRVLGVVPNREGPTLSWEAGTLYYHGDDYRAAALSDLEIEFGMWRGTEWAPAPPGSTPGTTFIARAARKPLVDTLVAQYSHWAIAAPDGGRIVLAAQLKDAGEYWVLAVPGDSVLTPLVPARQGLDFVGWSADGRSLFWQEGTEVFRWDFATREMVLLFALPTLPEDQKWIGGDARTSGSACQPRPGTDPVEFVCAINESVTELFRIENLSAGSH